MPREVKEPADAERDRSDQTESVTGEIAMEVDPCRGEKPAGIQDPVPWRQEALFVRDHMRMSPSIDVGPERHPQQEHTGDDVDTADARRLGDRCP